jgi:hypothetical protein
MDSPLFFMRGMSQKNICDYSKKIHRSHLLAPNFFFNFFVIIEKFLQKWITHPFFYGGGGVPQKNV